MYQIVVSRSAEKDLEKLPLPVVRRVAKAIDGLSEDPRPAGCKKLKGSEDDLWRIRVGDYRVVYSITDEIRVVDIRRIRHRKEVYE
jgi:mRNA interferase RelE/StbE